MPLGSIDKAKRKSFDATATLYDSARPSYPPELISDLLNAAHADRNSDVLEIGTGTGQLTFALAITGMNIAGLELGKNLADKAKSRLSGHDNVKIINGNFDTYHFDPCKFDLAVAATSYHWLDPTTRVARIAEALRTNGYMTIIETHHISGGSEQFFRDSQKCYKLWDPNTVEDYHLPSIDEVTLRKWEKETSPLFETVFSKTYQREIQYSGTEYVKLLKTYSDVLIMKNRNRRELLDCMKKMIESQYGDKITKKYLFELFVARKKAA